MNRNFKPSIDFSKMKKTNSLMSSGSVNNIPNDDLERILKLSLITADQENKKRDEDSSTTMCTNNHQMDKLYVTPHYYMGGVECDKCHQ